MTASKFKKRRRMEDTGSPLAEVKQDNIEAAKKQQSKEQETV
jgi:hypothetical protein